MKGVNVEAVLRVEDDEKNGGKRKNKSRQKEVEDDLGLSMLIDSQNNQYVLTKPRDSTMPRADHHFIKVSKKFLASTRRIQLFNIILGPKFPSFHCCAACAGFGVSGDAVFTLWLDLHSGWSSSDVWIHHLWGAAWSFRPQQHQGVSFSVYRCSVSMSGAISYARYFCAASRRLPSLCVAVYGPGGDSGGAGCVLHPLCGGTGILP